MRVADKVRRTVLNSSDYKGVRVIELDHGKVNALDLELLTAVIDAFRRLEQREPIVLTGAGRAFSAGVDLRRIVEGGADYTGEFLDALTRCFMAIFDHRGPVVAAINGPAVAGGCVIAGACDVRVISNGPIGLVELAVGVPFPTAALEIMRGLLGPRSRDVVLTARGLSAEEALSIGLVDQISSPETLLSVAFERATELAALPAGVYAHTKRQIQRPVRERIVAQAEEDREMVRLWSSPHVRDAVARSVEKLRHTSG